MNHPLGVAIVIIAVIFLLWLFIAPVSVSQTQSQHSQLNSQIRNYLESKDSPLVSDTEFLLNLEHWKLLIAISAIESQFCTQQRGYNCWGIGGDRNYRSYSSFRASAQDANDLIEYWQSKGKWLTVESMNGSYVVPVNSTWVRVVNKVMGELNELQSRTE